jgi:hypothetical protein
MIARRHLPGSNFRVAGHPPMTENLARSFEVLGRIPRAVIGGSNEQATAKEHLSGVPRSHLTPRIGLSALAGYCETYAAGSGV